MASSIVGLSLGPSPGDGIYLAQRLPGQESWVVVAGPFDGGAPLGTLIKAEQDQEAPPEAEHAALRVSFVALGGAPALPEREGAEEELLAAASGEVGFDGEKLLVGPWAGRLSRVFVEDGDPPGALWVASDASEEAEAQIKAGCQRACDHLRHPAPTRQPYDQDRRYSGIAVDLRGAPAATALLALGAWMPWLQRHGQLVIAADRAAFEGPHGKLLRRRIEQRGGEVYSGAGSAALISIGRDA